MRSIAQRSVAAGPRPAGRFGARWSGTIPYVAALCLLITSCTKREPLPVFFPVQSFSLTDQNAQNFGSDSLRGKVWVASFFFSSCTQICPTLVSQLQNLGRRVQKHGDAVRFVSISVDPEVDRPERLKAFAGERGIDLSRWTFLTGTPEEIGSTTRRVFLQPMPERRELAADPGYDVLHTSRVLLVDKQGRARGQLFTTDAAGLDALENAITDLLQE